MKTFTKLVLFIIAVSFLLMPFVAFGGVREQVAVAEAVVHVAQVTQPQLPNDFENKPRGEAPSTPPEVRHDAREKLTARPSLTINTPSSSQASPYDVTVYTAAWCGPCHSMRAKVGNGDERVRLQWVESAPPRGIPETYPTLCWTDASGTTRFVSGVRSLDQLVDLIERNNPPPIRGGGESIVAGGTVGDIRGRDAVASAIEFWRRHIGQAKATATWSRNGAQTLPLLKSSEWTPQALFGASGSIRFSAPGSNLPADEGELSYLIANDRIRLRGETSIELSRLIREPQSASAAEPAGVTPLTILSVIATVYQIINPTMDVTIPGDIEATGQLTGDVLTIKFNKAPSVRIVALFRFTLSVEAVEISSEKVRVVFGGSRWIRERTFEVR